MHRLIATVVLLSAWILQANSLLAAFGDERAIFFDRYDYPYTGNIAAMTAEINTMMQDAADQGFTNVIWQVRGRADALYNSNYEPSVYGLTSGFDPLQTALDAAHSQGLKLHAWLNSTTLWNTTSTNPPAGHIFHNTNPSFRIMDIDGNYEPQDGWSNYSSVNPILPEVHTHINNVIDDIAANYAVDGVHLDYIRYIPSGNSIDDFDRFPHDSISHQMFSDATGGLDGSDPANFTEYKEYIRDRITDLVASVGQTVNSAEGSTGRAMEYSASVWRDPDIGENYYLQDYRTWLENDYLDTVMPMIYLSESNDDLYFNNSLLNTLKIATNTRVVPTLASYLHTQSGGGGVELTISQVERAHLMGADDVNFYDYPSYFDDYSNADQQALKDYLDSINDPNSASPGNVIDDFEADEGHFTWSVTSSPQTEGLSATSTINRVTTEAQAGSASQELNLIDDGAPGSWTLRHVSGAGSPANNDPLDATGYVGFWLKTDDPGMTVQLVVDDPGTGEQGFLQPIVADDQWHLYQWNLEDDRQWESWINGNGSIDESTVTVDSIFFYGNGDATIYMDSVSHNPDEFLAGIMPIDGDFDGDGDVDHDDLIQWQGDVGVNGFSDADGDGDSDGRDFLIWQQNYTGPSAMSATTAAVPEPGAAALIAAAAFLLLTLRTAHRSTQKTAMPQ